MKDLYIVRAVSEAGTPGYSLWQPGITNKFFSIAPKRLCFNESLVVVEAAKRHLGGETTA